jgi:hypothetical protein
VKNGGENLADRGDGLLGEPDGLEGLLQLGEASRVGLG